MTPKKRLPRPMLPSEMIKTHLPDIPESYGESYYVKTPTWGGDYAEAQDIVWKQSGMFWSVGRDLVFPAGAKVLDAGCAYGHAVKAWNDRGYDAYGYDHSPYAIERGHAMYPDLGERIWVQSITDPIPVTVQAITCTEVLEHVPPENLEKVLDNFQAASNWLFTTVGLSPRFGVPLPDTDTDPTHIHWPHKSWWCEFLEQWGHLDWDIMHRFALTAAPMEKDGISWGVRFFALEFFK